MDDMEGKIVLDRKSFEALAVDSRVRILKSLKERRKTLSEVASEQKMSLSGVKEHLETLERVGLIAKKDDGHKWKYYELTKKGMDIVAPRELRVWILLSLSTFALVASMFALFSVPEPMMQDAAYGGGVPEAAQAIDAPMLATAALPEADVPENTALPPEESMKASDIGESRDTETGDPEPATGNGGLDAAAAYTPEDTPGPAQPYTMPLAVAVISALTLLGCLAVLARNRMRFTFP